MKRVSLFSFVLLFIFSQQFFSCKNNLPTPEINVVAGNEFLQVSWNAVAGASSYIIYYQEGTTCNIDQAIEISPASSPQKIENLENGTEYTIIVIAIGLRGKQSPVSEGVTMAPTPLVVNTPTNFKLDNALYTGEAIFSWDSIENADGYNLYYKKGEMTSRNDEEITIKTGITQANIPYTLLGLTPGEQYSALIAAYIGSGSDINYSSDSLIIQFTIPLNISSPIDLKVSTYDETSITLTWSPNSSATSYNLYYKENDGVDIEIATATLLKDISSPYQLTGLTTNQPYRVAVSSVTGTKISPPGNNVVATPQENLEVTQAPILISATSGEEQANLSWTIHEKAETYELYYNLGSSLNEELIFKEEFLTSNFGTTGQPKITTVAGVDYITYEQIGLIEAQEYTFAIKANNSLTDNPPFSNSRTTTIGGSASGETPSTPIILNISTTDSGVILNFTEENEKANKFILYYVQTSVTGVLDGETIVIEKVKTEGTPIEIIKTDESESPYSVTGLTNSIEYAFVIEAVNTDTDPDEISQSSNAVKATPQELTDVPNQPNFLLNAGDSEVTLTWIPNNTVDGYNIYWLIGENIDDLASATKITIADSTINSEIISTLSNGTTYAFIVTAYNAIGESTHETQRTATPTKINAPYLINTEAGDSQITISWIPVIDAQYYNIYYREGDTLIIAGSTKIDGSAIGENIITNEYLIESLTNSQQYTFGVTAVDSEETESDLSNIISESPNIPPSGAPNGVTVYTNSDGYFDVSWTTVVGADDYEIYIQQGIENITTGIRAFAEVITTQTSARIYVSSPDDYMVAVRAVNSAGSSDLTNAEPTTISSVAGEVNIIYSPAVLLAYVGKQTTKVTLFTEGTFWDTTHATVNSVIYFPQKLESQQNEMDETHILPGTYKIKAILYKTFAGIISDKESNKLDVTINGDSTFLVSEDSEGNLIIEKQ